jgi:hypothetical protein
MTAPTLTSYAESSAAIAASPRVTASLSWNAGDTIFVIGITETSGNTLGTPTASGLSFSLVDSDNTVSNCQAYLWTATAGSAGSDTISATQNASFSAVLQAWAFNGQGIGARTEILASSASTHNLTRVFPDSAVIFAVGDWNALSDVTVTWSPSSGVTQRHATEISAHATYFTADWGGQGAAGTTAYGFTDLTGTPRFTGYVVEVRGPPESPQTLIRGFDSSPWTIPDNVNAVTAEVWGAGGGGGGNTLSTDGGSGGGGGAYSIREFTGLTPGATISWSIGAGGTAGAQSASTTAGTGGTTWFSSNDSSGAVAVGGVGGTSPSSGGTPAVGGLGGDAASGFGTTKYSGGKGEAGRNSATGRGGYGGSSAGTGANGFSGPDTWSTQTYPTGSTPTGAAHGGDGGTGGAGTAGAVGGGGGGGRGDSAGVGMVGGDGKIILTWEETTDLDVAIDTAGAVTIAGQSVASKLGVSITTAGAISIAGQTVNVALNPGIGTAGQVTIAGESADFALTADLFATIDAGAVTIQGQSVDASLGLNVENAGAVTIAGQDVGAAVSENLFAPIDTAGSLTIAGQSLSASLGVEIDTAGALTVEGQSFTTSLGVALSEAGALTIAGEDVALSLGANLATTIDVAGALTIQGQDVGSSLGVTISDAGSVTISGEEVALSLGNNLSTTIDVAGSVTVEGQSVGVAIGANVDEAGSVTIGGEDLTAELTANLFATIDVAGAVTIAGQDVAVELTDLTVEIDQAGSIAIEGQECALQLSGQASGGIGKPRKRAPRRKIRPEELPAFEVEVNFLQPWQECSATVEVSEEQEFAFEQEGALLNSTAESVTDVSVEVRQEVAELIASFYLMPIRSAPAKAMPKPETARVRVAIDQAAHELSATVEIG